MVEIPRVDISASAVAGNFYFSDGRL